MLTKKKRRYSSVAEMVRSLSEDPSFADEFEKRLAERQLIKLLAVLRTKTGLSPQELADKLDWALSKISRLESSNDADVRLGDLVDYARALDHQMHIFLVPMGQCLDQDTSSHEPLLEQAERAEMITFPCRSRADIAAGRTEPAVKSLDRLNREHRLNRKRK